MTDPLLLDTAIALAVVSFLVEWQMRKAGRDRGKIYTVVLCASFLFGALASVGIIRAVAIAMGIGYLF